MTGFYPFHGYIYVGGSHGITYSLSTQDEITKFLKENLYSEKLVITDASDELWYESMEGVDLFSRLNELGIHLPAIFQQVRKEIYQGEAETCEERQSWEDLYDSIGLSPGEIAMRKRVKRQLRMVKTVQDVINLVQETYFDAVFSLPGETETWGYFDPDECSVTIYREDSDRDLENDANEVIPLSLTLRVKHISSGEDIHHFELIDFAR